jgi:small subunit ribosomal protein S9
MSEFEEPGADEPDVSSETPPVDDASAQDETAASISEETPGPPAPAGEGGEQEAAASDAEVPAAEPVPEEPAAEPVAEEAPAEPVAEEAPAPAEEAPAPAPAEEAPDEPAPVAEVEVDVIDEPADGLEAEEATSEEEPEDVVVEDVVVEDDTEIAEGDVEEIELTPRLKPEIPGADLIPDIIPEGEEFLDAEAQAAAEAEAEAEAAREQEDQAEAQPIADAAIDLAAGARYTATGKRKTAVARVILKPGSGSYAINGKVLDDYFPRETLRRVIRQPLETVGYESRMDVVARMHGGGVAAQAGALRHGISRALLEADPNLRGELKRRGFLTRDPRVKERKKAGLKKARKRPQFSKR